MAITSGSAGPDDSQLPAAQETQGTGGPEGDPSLVKVFFAGAGVLLFALVASIAMSGEPILPARMEPGTVESSTWRRTIWVATRSLEAGEGWELPDSAVDVVRGERPRGQRQQLEGDRPVPAMAAWYTYRLPTWTTTDTLQVAGTWMNEPVWPDTAFGPGRREAGRMETYHLVVRDARGARTYMDLTLRQEEWARFRAGQRVAFTPGYATEPRIIPADSTRACRQWHAGRTRHPPDGLGCSPRRR